MEASPDAKSVPSSPEATKDSASTPKSNGHRLSDWRKRIQTSCRQWTWPAYRQFLQRSKAPILVGPFLGEVGLETLYWEPFVAQFRQDTGIPAERLIPITRSGAAWWYRCPKAIDVYGMRTIQEVRVANKIRVARTGMLKQATVSDFERAIYRDVADTLKLTTYHTLHPAWMYQTLKPYWEAQTGVMWLNPRVRYQPFPIPELEIALPETFIAAKFYARSTWPPNADTATFARGALEQMAKLAPVVLMTSNLVMDDHADFIPKPLPANVILLSDLIQMEPTNSLAVVSHVMGKALGFVGTYGGLSHLALRYGKPSVSLYTHWEGACVAHKHLAELLAMQQGIPAQVLRVADLAMVQDVLPKIVNEPVGTAG